VRKGNIELKLNFDESIEPLGIFVSEMNQVWTNLIDNAIDAMENSDSKVLEIASSQNKREVEVRIIDSGSGIEEEVLNKIFDPFFTTKDVGKGTGLGLDTSLKIVQKHSGEIKVNSEAGRTEFLVKLPKDI